MPLETTRVSPRATLNIASVAMNGGSLPYAVAAPEAIPAARPVSNPKRRSTIGGIPHDWPVKAATIADRAATLPTDRSMPAVTMTKVWPKARMATTEAWMPTFSRLFGVRKSGVATNMATPEDQKADQSAVVGDEVSDFGPR